MPEKPTRREALVTIAGAAACGSFADGPLRAAPYEPKTFSEGELRLVTLLVDMILPPSDTPGAAAAGVDRIIDQDLAANEKRREIFLKGLKLLEQAAFSGKSEEDRVRLLTEYSEAPDERGEFFKALKDMTIDGYYSTEIGVVQELGYQGNTYLREFPGCQHEEHL